MPEWGLQFKDERRREQPIALRGVTVPWFHGMNMRMFAEDLLRKHGMQNGLFLVREDRMKQLQLAMAFNVRNENFLV
jgi:hypothetical protein